MIVWTSKKGNVERFHRLLDGAKQQFGDEVVETLLRPSSGPIPFLIACRAGKIDMVKGLFSFKGIDMTKLRSQRNENALHVAAKHVEVARFIIEKCSLSKEEINKLLCEETSEGKKPIDCALQNGTLATAEYLWKRESSHTLKEHGQAVYFAASQASGITFLKDVLTSAKRRYEREVARILNFQKEGTKSPLSIASEKGFSEMVKILLSFEETEITLADSSNSTALHWAAKAGHLEIVKLLLGESSRLWEDEKMDLAKRNYHKEVAEVCSNALFFLCPKLPNIFAVRNSTWKTSQKNEKYMGGFFA